ncbi:MAG: MOSC domain-containing protein [Steroidobacteraceae bacterium]
MNEIREARVASVQAGKIRPLGPEGVPSAFVKDPVEGPVSVVAEGLALDEQADRRVHGGSEKAVYAYASSHYPLWASEFPEQAGAFVAGGFGENLTVDGLDESDLCVGDVHAIGTTLLQVCQPRQPCFKLALRFGNNRLPKAMVRNDRSGWYYRVLSPGVLQAGDRIVLVDRPLPDFPFEALLEFLYTRGLDEASLQRVAGTELLPPELRREARRELAARQR